MLCRYQNRTVLPNANTGLLEFMPLRCQKCEEFSVRARLSKCCTSYFLGVNYSNRTSSDGVLNYEFRNEHKTAKQNQANDVSCN